MRSTTTFVALSIALCGGDASAQGSRESAAQDDLHRREDERAVARQQVRVAREQDRLDALRETLDLTTAPVATPVPDTGNSLVTGDTPQQSSSTTPAPTPAQTKAALRQAEGFADIERNLAARKAAQDFGEFGLGAGLSLTIDLGSKDRIADAQIVNGIVRVIDQNNAVARLLLETHYFFKPQRSGPFGLEEKMWGLGPFVAIQPGDERIVEAIGLGLMIGFRREETRTDSFNIGIGFMIDPNTRVLGDGFVANAAPPPGETEVRYRETAQKGLMLLTSFSF